MVFNQGGNYLLVAYLFDVFVEKTKAREGKRMNKLFKHLTASLLGLSMAVGVGVAVANVGKKAAEVDAASSYTLTFKTGSGDGTSCSTGTAASAIFSDASGAYVTGNLAAASNAYYGGDLGLKLGTSKASGTVKMNLSSTGQVKAKSIVVNAKLYNSSKSATLKVNGPSTQNLTASFANYTYTVDSTSNLTYIELTSSKYAWVSSITVNCVSTAVVSDLTITPTENVVIDGENAVYTKTAQLQYAITYDGDEGEGTVEVSVSPATGLAYSDDGKGTITLTGKVNGDYTVTVATVEKDSSGNPVSVDKAVKVQNLLVKSNPAKLTSLANLQIADQVFIVNDTNGKAAGDLTDTYLSAVSATFEDGYMTEYDEEDVKSFIVGKQLTNWTFNTADGLLGMGTSKNSISIGDSTANTHKFILSISDEASNYSVTFESSTTSGLKLQFNSTRFSNYTSSQTAIQFYVIHATDAGVAAEFEENYLVMGKSVEGQCMTYYANAKYVYNGLTASQKSNISLEGMARLQAWAAANGDVIDGSGNIVTKTANSIFVNGDNNVTTVIIVVFSIVSLTTVCGIIVGRKRKEN